MKTISAKADGVKRDWFVVDATNKTLGRLCSELAHRLRGKHKPIFTPHVDTGDYLVVINAEKIAVTGKRKEDGESLVDLDVTLANESGEVKVAGSAVAALPSR